MMHSAYSSSNNAWNWNYDNEDMNNNNRNNNNRCVVCRDYSKGLEHEPIAFEDLWQAYLLCKRNKSSKFASKKYEMHSILNVERTRRALETRTWVPSRHIAFIVKEPSLREVFACSFSDRVVHHFAMSLLTPTIDKTLIYDTASCRDGKGTDFAIKRVSTFIKRERSKYNEVYFLKKDISGFFMSIDRNILLDKSMDILNHKYKGPYLEVLRYLLPIFILRDVTKGAIKVGDLSLWDKLPKRKTLYGKKTGLPIGNLPSQILANLMLSDLDHTVKHFTPCYERYVDDMVVVSHSKELLKEIDEVIDNKLEEIHMKANPRKRILSLSNFGIHFLGKKIYPDFIVYHPTVINRFFLKTREKQNDIEALYRSLSCRRAMIKLYSGRNVLFRAYESLPSSVRSYLKIDSQGHFLLKKSA